MNWKVTLKGFFAAFIGGAATSATVMIGDPAKFNFSDGFTSLAKVMICSGIFSGCMYLKQSPVRADTGSTPPQASQPKD